MTRTIRLPVAPRPFRDELLSSWMARVAGRYGLEPQILSSFLAGQGGEIRRVDDMEPDPGLLQLWARVCRIDPARLTRLSLVVRYPDRPRSWLVGDTEGPVPSCLTCFDADWAAQRDSHMRARWRLADQIVCPDHREMLQDRCPCCRGRLRVSLRIRGSLLRPFCDNCDGLLTGRGGDQEDRSVPAFADLALDLQRQVGRIIRADADHCARLEAAICTLWAPLDRTGAARPVLALWLEQPGWHCPVEVRSAVGTPAPFQHLPVHWRTLTLVVLRDLFGAELVCDTAMPEAAHNLFRRAAPMPWRHQDRTTGVRTRTTSEEDISNRVRRLSKNPVHR